MDNNFELKMELLLYHSIDNTGNIIPRWERPNIYRVNYREKNDNDINESFDDPVILLNSMVMK